jgi:hypothetical protein
MTTAAILAQAALVVVIFLVAVKAGGLCFAEKPSS